MHIRITLLAFGMFYFLAASMPHEGHAASVSVLCDGSASATAGWQTRPNDPDPRSIHYGNPEQAALDGAEKRARQLFDFGITPTFACNACPTGSAPVGQPITIACGEPTVTAKASGVMPKDPKSDPNFKEIYVRACKNQCISMHNGTHGPALFACLRNCDDGIFYYSDGPATHWGRVTLTKSCQGAQTCEEISTVIDTY